jgi:excisionase family DNA binding protein
VKRKITYSDLKYSIRILNNGDGSFSVEVPKLPGCYSAGRTKDDCVSNAVEAIELHLEGLKRKPLEDVIPEIEVVHDVPRVDDYLISLPEACRFLDVSDATIRRYIKGGKIPAYSFGKEYKFKIQELSEFVDSSRVGPKKVS